MLTPHYIQIPTNAPYNLCIETITKVFLRNGQHSFRRRKKEKNLTRSFSCIYSYLLYVLQFATISSHLHKHAHIEFPNVPARPTISPLIMYVRAVRYSQCVYFARQKRNKKRRKHFFRPPSFALKIETKCSCAFFSLRSFANSMWQ